MTCIFTQRHYGPCHAFTFPSLIQIWSTPSVIMNTVESGMSKCAHYICTLITKIISVQSYFCYHRLLWLQENMQLSVWKTKTAWYKSKLFKQASLFLSYNALSLHEKRILNATSLWKGLRCNCSWWEACTARRYADNLKTSAFCVIDSFVWRVQYHSGYIYRISLTVQMIPIPGVTSSSVWILLLLVILPIG